MKKRKIKYGKRELKVLKNLPGNPNLDIGKATKWMIKNSPFSKQELIISCLHKECGLSIKPAKGSTVSSAECKARILLQPRLESKGDPRGSVNVPWGHLAYIDLLERRIDPLTGKPEKQKYALRSRKKALPPLKRTTYVKVKDRVASEKVRVRRKAASKKAKAKKRA